MTKNMSKSNLGVMEKTGSGIGLQKQGNKPPVGGSAKPGKIYYFMNLFKTISNQFNFMQDFWVMS